MCSTKAGISIITLHVKITSLDQFLGKLCYTTYCFLYLSCRCTRESVVLVYTLQFQPGFYLNDVWTSFVCSTRHFTTPTTTECLKDNTSTWWETLLWDSGLSSFVKEVPSEITSCLLFIYTYKIVICGINGIIFVGVICFSALKQMNLHVEYQSGPLIAVDVETTLTYTGGLMVFLCALWNSSC